MQAAAAEPLRCDPKYLGTAVRLSKGGKNGSISGESKSCEITGAAADVFTVLVEGAKKKKKFTLAELTFPLRDPSAMPSSTNDMNAFEMPPAEGIHGSLQQDMANGADTKKGFLSVPDASAHEEKKQLEQPAEKQKCMGVSKAGRQCIQFALPGCERCRRHANKSELTDDNGSEGHTAFAMWTHTTFYCRVLCSDCICRAYALCVRIV